ncbi:MAG: hypothetical protein C7B46_13295 [Sulfobacillus benefaciens]|uniref:Uncharacterized protein n=1 Tax=Sulfobacillus benefaciens TaxID=453960 RepID=A0A2T2XE42_9FIRM|nr:MAG: hypothetical protein C7B46_13295 [Sulfobacillus benefaciens]
MANPPLNEFVRRLETNFWDLLARRYPLTRWRWDKETADLSLFPEWTRVAFQKEYAEWRSLIQETERLEDPEAHHWGRFARIATMHIHSESFRHGAKPLRLANLTLTAVALLDPEGHRFPRDQLLSSFNEWLSNTTDVTASSTWRRVQIEAEATNLIGKVEQWSRFDPGATEPGARLREMALTVIGDYLTRVKAADDGIDAVPWLHSAHMSVEEWRERRKHLTQESPIPITRPMITAEILDRNQFPSVPIQEVVIPGHHPWWLQSQATSDTLFHGSRYLPSITFALIFSLWRSRSTLRPLTWALTPPPILEGGLVTASAWLRELNPNWAPARTHYLAQWCQQRRALAIADAWLWGEGGRGSEVLSWLARYVGPMEALRLIPWMKENPGYYVLSLMVYEVMSKAEQKPNWQHPFWLDGPIMPYELFVAPND